MDDATAKDILHLLIDSDPLSLMERDTYAECLPIHYAAGCEKSTEFCKILVRVFNRLWDLVFATFTQPSPILRH